MDEKAEVLLIAFLAIGLSFAITFFIGRWLWVSKENPSKYRRAKNWSIVVFVLFGGSTLTPIFKSLFLGEADEKFINEMAVFVLVVPIYCAAAFLVGLIWTKLREDSPKLYAKLNISQTMPDADLESRKNNSIPKQNSIHSESAISSKDSHQSTKYEFEIEEEQAWAKALNEYESPSRRQGLWAKSFSESNGDETLAKAMYLKWRMQQLLEKNDLSESSHHQIIDKPNANSIAGTHAGQVADESPHLNMEEIEYLEVPISAFEYLRKYRVSEDQLERACARKKIKAVIRRGVLWVSDRKIQ